MLMLWYLWEAELEKFDLLRASSAEEAPPSNQMLPVLSPVSVDHGRSVRKSSVIYTAACQSQYPTASQTTSAGSSSTAVSPLVSVAQVTAPASGIGEKLFYEALSFIANPRWSLQDSNADACRRNYWSTHSPVTCS